MEKLNYVSVSGDVLNSPDEEMAYSIDWLRIGGPDWEFTFDFEGEGGANEGLDAWISGELFDADEQEPVKGEDFENYLTKATYAEVGVWPLDNVKESELENVSFRNVVITVELGNARRVFETNTEVSLTF